MIRITPKECQLVDWRIIMQTVEKKGESMNPSPETCRQLTLYLGECWHEGMEVLPSSVGSVRTPCKKCGINGYNRTFTTPADLFAVFGKMVEKGDWGEFWEHAKMEFYRSPNWNGCGFADTTWVIAWLFCLAAPDQIWERMEMAARWMEGRK